MVIWLAATLTIDSVNSKPCIVHPDSNQQHLVILHIYGQLPDDLMGWRGRKIHKEINFSAPDYIQGLKV